MVDSKNHACLITLWRFAEMIPANKLHNGWHWSPDPESFQSTFFLNFTSSLASQCLMSNVQDTVTWSRCDHLRIPSPHSPMTSRWTRHHFVVCTTTSIAKMELQGRPSRWCTPRLQRGKWQDVPNDGANGKLIGGWAEASSRNRLHEEKQKGEMDISTDCL